MADYKAEIIETERAFAQLAREQGLKTAFLAYADDGAVLNREGRLIKGKREIGEYYDKQTARDVRLEWAPDFVAVAAAGDLAYTYGRFTYTGTDQAGQAIRFEGIFHTVWKRNPDGAWRYVWD